MAMLAVSVAVSTACAFFASSIDIGKFSGIVIATSIPLLGFALYDVIYACVGAALDRHHSSWFQDFRRHVAFSTPLVVLAFSINVVLALIMTNLLRTQYQVFVLIFIVDYVVISGYWSVLSLRHAKRRENRRLGESISQRFWRSSATTVSLNVALVVVSAFTCLVFNAGAQKPGPLLPQLLP